MLAGIFHEGSGLGDQLFRYITVRTLAEKKRFDWCMLNPDNFKGFPFLNPDMSSIFPANRQKMEGAIRWFENDVRDGSGNDIRSYDPEINFIQQETVIDGSFEDSKYWGKNLSSINQWLKVEPLIVSEDTCVIGFRGGEYAAIPELFLPTSYYEQGITKMHKINPKIKFEVHSDDPRIAELMLTPIFGTNKEKITYVQNQQISHSKHSNMGFNWRSARYAKYAIIPNSAFFIIPRLLKHHEDPEAVTIAPRYWAGRNVKQWRRPACYYPEFLYV